jgi:glutaminase
MDRDPLPDDRPETERVSTGVLPPDTDVQALVTAGYERYLHLDEGAVADYIPALAAASPDAFGVCVAGVHGRLFSVGDADPEFAIESISKLFVFALVCQALGHEEARRKLGVNSTGLPFNSVMAIELNTDRTMNPLVNAGAMATTSLVPGTTADEKFESIAAAMSRFAGRRLVMDDDVYESETATNDRNRGIAHLLDGYGRMYCDPDLATDVYTRQCSVRVSARDLAVMGATLANGGVNPVTGEQAIDTRYCKRVLAVLATAGLYEHSGQWLYDVGLPGKSGVAGGIVPCRRAKGASAHSPRRSMRQATACGGNASPGTSQKRWGSTSLPRLLLPDTSRSPSCRPVPPRSVAPARFCRGQRVYGALHEARSAIPILRPKGIAVTELVTRGRVRGQVAGESG